MVTVEHDEEWFNILKLRIEEKRLKNWAGCLVGPEPGDLVEAPSTSDPDHYSSGGIKNVNFKNYASAIDVYPDEYFDVVMVDGRSRPACLKHAAPKLKKGGLLVLDNADRAYYIGEAIKRILKEYTLLLSVKGASPYCETFTQTNIWKKN